MSADTRAMMLYDSRKKSVAASYLLWVCLGAFGAHRFYNGRVGSGVAILVLNVVGAATSFIGIGLVLLLVAGTWIIVDLFLIPGWVREYNLRLVEALEAGGPFGVLRAAG